MKQKQSGFTLIEIAIVLVIIGLLLGGVLKGQELINSAKVKNLATDFKNIPVFIYGYQDKFRSIPGDDGQAASHVTGATEASTPTTGLNGVACSPAAGNAGCVANGVLDGSWNSTTTTDESVLFWQHVRMAGLAPGSTTPGVEGYMPQNAVGGEIGIQGGTNSLTTTAITNNDGTLASRGSYVICSPGILGKFAKQLDTQMDDGNPNTGSMMAGPAAAAIGTPIVAETSLEDANTYTVCMGI